MGWVQETLNLYSQHTEKFMVNNIDRIRELISFEDEFDFYFLQILKRRKDNPDLKRDMVVIVNYHIDIM